jgi:hypothetical protein
MTVGMKSRLSLTFTANDWVIEYARPPIISKLCRFFNFEFIPQNGSFQGFINIET